MKQNRVKPHNEFEIPYEYYDNNLQYSTVEIDAMNIYRLACTYSSPFMPMIDLTIVLEELMRVFKKWLLLKRKKQNSYK